MSPQRDSLLQNLLSQPTAPFREAHVMALISWELGSAGVPYFFDPVGNLVVGVADLIQYRRLLNTKTEEPLRFFIAHTDHPGFHGCRWDFSTLQVKWHGGTPTQHLLGAPVWLADSQGWLAHGTLLTAELGTSRPSIETATLQIDEWLRPDFDVATFQTQTPTGDIFGGFRFRAPVWKEEGDLIYTKAADDLVGAFAITALALDWWSQNKKKRTAALPPFLGLLTRAEEVGFVGAIGHFELGWLNPPSTRSSRSTREPRRPRPLVCISLETSRTLPGAEIGKGPIVRLGDRYTVFEAGGLRVLTDLAQKLLPGKHQRRVMDGGTCEATAATVYGFPSIGISIPLGNYHNQSFEGGPDSRGPQGPAPEFVHAQDIEGLMTLCHGLLQPKLPWTFPWRSRKKEFKKSLIEYRALLKTGKNVKK